MTVDFDKGSKVYLFFLQDFGGFMRSCGRVTKSVSKFCLLVQFSCFILTRICPSGHAGLACRKWRHQKLRANHKSRSGAVDDSAQK